MIRTPKGFKTVWLPVARITPSGKRHEDWVRFLKCEKDGHKIKRTRDAVRRHQAVFHG